MGEEVSNVRNVACESVAWAYRKGRPGRPWTSLVSDCKWCRTVNIHKINENLTKLRRNSNLCSIQKKDFSQIHHVLSWNLSDDLLLCQLIRITLWFYKNHVKILSKSYVGLILLSDSKFLLDVPNFCAAVRRCVYDLVTTPDQTHVTDVIVYTPLFQTI